MTYLKYSQKTVKELFVISNAELGNTREVFLVSFHIICKQGWNNLNKDEKFWKMIVSICGFQNEAQ